ncbi:MAG: hypothetical protein GTO45_34870 [Candidatus Aminicenantes bacterium]|nr:hypothetical protein [Candidatus Aminicenantes bacterium]NIM83876.1 hypothetical protein [Candidatus Aminicenantes bacterium]NIN23340.1 hypothetical protein [Candidatus Aminicenantes bacterium]NIN47042.1 hypothetical protein [Candidatus Aminicenantes bacterium]NIN89966.1 hypothetical protein [Candidatus Aminicenantes bacterium]
MKRKKILLFTLGAVLLIMGMNAADAQSQETVQTEKILKEPVLEGIPVIKQIVPVYDGCQLIFYVKGKFFGADQGFQGIQLKSSTQTYTPQIIKWSPTKIDCFLKGAFELGRNYKVYLWDNATNKVCSNQYDWLVKTKLTLTDQGYKPGQVISLGGCLLGYVQDERKVMVGNVEAIVTQWVCEDILFRVPKLPPGVYPLYLQEGPLIISNKIKIKII